jgi:hypothetical protein
MLTRRRLMSRAAGASAALAAGPIAAQVRLSDEVAFFAACRDLSAFDPLPHRLTVSLMARLPEPDRDRVIAEGARLRDGALRRRVLHALYRGVLPAPGDDSETVTRIGYADALMFATVEDRLIVPSYCGGLPAYWQAHPGAA